MQSPLPSLFKDISFLVESLLSPVDWESISMILSRVDCFSGDVFPNGISCMGIDFSGLCKGKRYLIRSYNEMI